MQTLLLSALAAILIVPADSVMRNVEIDEVEVISTVKENTSMRQQPSSSTILGKQQLEANHVTSIKGISAMVPNFFMPDYGSRLTSAIYIRGVGSRMNTPAVGMYVDNVPYVEKSAFDFNFYDVERVDVLRGPQGTLYGRNAMGGLLRVYTKNPFSYAGTDLNLGYATKDNRRTVSLTHYHRISPKFAFSAGGYYDSGDGFYEHSIKKTKVDHTSAAGGRWRGIMKPTERLTLDLTASFDYNDDGAYPYFYASGQSDQYPAIDAVGPRSSYVLENNRDHSYRRALANGGLNLEYRADAFVMNAITGYQFLDDRMFLDQDFLNTDLYTLEQKQRSHTISEEITFKNAQPRVWEWVNGVSLMCQSLHTSGPVTFYKPGLTMLSSNVNSQMPNATNIPMLAGMGFTEMAVNFRGDQLKMGGTFDTPTLNAALFHQTTVHLSDRFSAVIGLRLDYERMHMDYNAPATVDYGFLLDNPNAAMMKIDLQDLTANLLYRGKLNDNYLRVLPKAALKYDFDRHNNIYASVAKGQRSGGYNVQMFSDLLQGAMKNAMMNGIVEGVKNYMTMLSEQNPSMPAAMVDKVVGIMRENMPIGDDPTVDQVAYRPEYSWNYELGTHLATADNRLQIDAALFFMKTRDQQIARFAESGLGRQMVNAGKSQSYGAELSLRWRPTEKFTFMANYGFTNSKFKEYDGGNGIDYSGNYVPFVPKHTLNLDADRTLYSGTGFLRSLSLGVNYTGAGRIYWLESNTASQAYYSLLGARAVFETKHAALTLWAKNITATEYNSFLFISNGNAFVQFGRPFQLGADLRIKF